MAFIPRRMAAEIACAARHFPAVVVTGPRRAGETTLLRRWFPKASYALLEDPDVVARVRATRGYEVDRVLVHRPAPTAAGQAIRPGTRALRLEELLAEI